MPAPPTSRSPVRVFTPLLLAVCLATGCAEDTKNDTADSAHTGGAPTEYSGPPVAFDEALVDVLVPSCGFDSCHGSGAGYLRIHEGQTEAEWLEKYSNVLITRALIVPGDAATSYLVKKMEGSSDIEGTVMPPSGSIDAVRIGMVRSWIDNIPTD